MSSIYKKGRDGYYYYQAYVYNPISKKKDKRIFHALGTKDFNEAKTKQHELDKINEQKKKSKLGPLIKLSILKKFSVVAGLIIIVTIGNRFFISNKNTYKSSNLIVSQKVDAPKEIIENNAFSDNYRKEDILLENSNESDEGLITNSFDSEIVIPKYVIERAVKLSDVFAQGKLFVNIDEKSNNASQQMLCKILRNQYKEFSNIIICLYADNKIGKDLARGKDDNISYGEQKKFWLAMYTYNDVEGEYFDDNPGRYLGNF